MPRYAMVVVVEGDYGEVCWEAAAVALGQLARLDDDPPPVACYVGNPCPIPDSDRDIEYATEKVVLYGGTAHPIETDPSMLNEEN